ncbi:N-acetylglucosamine-6-phosphate deacetylase [Thermococcus aggregans]|uniref:N-acetylglucosamine-6-phosphate deacetylase n=1 Tax=Thermococcus aggregans TaxID=110163 RepID=A0A9E7MWC5_THEAG|nr:N-acetylglucosamine-6-phosphate deacetylase [Thermococcus aggregans]USS40139.1 N-acetylglucosamine-6-phosphate deacetylase [Thermococcus aggregans]
MSKVILTNARVITPFEEIYPGTVEIENGIIKKVYEGRTSGGENLEGKIVAPGFIDVHTHGIGGFDVTYSAMGGSEQEVEETLIKMSEKYLTHGVVYFLPTTVTASHEVLLTAAKGVKNAVSYQKDQLTGAKIGGLHLEGPYINKEKKGAQNPEFIRLPNIQELKEYWKASEGNIKTITIAPELEGALEFIQYARRLGVSVSLGHTNATYEEAKAAIYAGANRASHLYNAMRPINHRDPGVIAAALESPQVYVELITDLIHLSPEIIKFTVNHTGIERVVVITDSIIATDLPDGEYSLGGLKVIVKDGICRLEDGTLAGSTLTMDKALRNLIQTGFSLKDAIRAMTYNPARAIELHKSGAILPGYSADLVILDEDLNVDSVYINGKNMLS